MKRALTALPAAAAIFLLAGCGGVEPDDTYSDAADLQDALNSEDFRCTGGEASTFDSGYAEEIVCDEGISLAVWEEDAPEYIDGPAVAAMGASLMGNSHMLTSDTWLIRSDNAGLIGEMAPVFGGSYSGSDDELMCEYNRHVDAC